MNPATQLKETICEVVTSEEYRQSYFLKDTNKDFLTTTLTEFIQDSIRKFIEGTIEHDDGGDFLTDVAHLQELRKEQIDSLMYLSAAIKAQQSKV